MKKQTQAETELTPVGMPFITGLNQIKSNFQQKHSRRWAKNKASKTARMIIPKPSAKMATQLISMNREELSTMIRLFTSHGIFESHCENIGVGNDTNYRFCKEDEEDCLHILCECLALEMLGYHRWGIAFLAKDQLTKIGVAELLRFANKAGLVV